MVHEALLAVDDAAVVDAGLRVDDVGALGACENRTAIVGGAMTSAYPAARAASASVCTGSAEPTAAANAAIRAASTAYGPLGG